MFANYASARRIAAQFGARLPSWKTPLERGILMRGIEIPFWLGLRQSGRDLILDDGTVVHRAIGFSPERKYGCMFAPYLSRSGALFSRNPAICLPLVLEWPSR